MEKSIMTKTKKLRNLLSRSGLLIVPKVGDGLGAKIVEESGFEAFGVSGHVVSATFGMPDLGLITMTEMVRRAAIVAASVDIPCIADGDTGYGNAINVYRSVQEFERAGVAAIHFEDQVSPKRCGQLTGKSLISIEEMLGKLQAAVDSRTDKDFLLIKRGRAYEKGGADIIYAVIHRGPRMIDEVRTLAASFSCPLMIDVSEAGPQPISSFADLSNTGLKIASLPLTLGLFTPATAMRRAAKEISQFGLEGLRSVMERNDPWDSVERLIGLDRFNELGARYTDQAIAQQIVRPSSDANFKK
jgi:2-methylisocitrate lyase-like PEP mutase family enzyme